MLDQFLGSGTTLVEAKLLNRKAIGVDINQQAISISKENLNFPFDSQTNIYIKQGSAMNLSFIKDEKIDFICTHPPYADIIKYSEDIIGDISLLDVSDFIQCIQQVALESHRVLKRTKYCAVMIGDVRKKGKLTPLGFELMNCFLNSGFVLKEIIIKEQHNCRSTVKWMNKKRNFLMLAHEYIFVFQKI